MTCKHKYTTIIDGPYLNKTYSSSSPNAICHICEIAKYKCSQCGQEIWMRNYPGTKLNYAILDN